MGNVLIAEDSTLCQSELKLVLEELGYNVMEQVTSGEEAIEFCKQKQPDIILMDIVLKGKLDGIETAKKIKQLLDIPIIYLTGYDNKDLLDRVDLTQEFLYLTKPVSKLELRNNIEILLSKNKLKKKLEQREKLFREIFETAGTAILIIKADDTIEMANKEFILFSGYTEKEVKKRKWTEFVYKEDLQWLMNSNQRQKAGNKDMLEEYELRFVSKEGKTRYAKAKVKTMPYCQKRVISLLDITDLKLKQEAISDINSLLDSINRISAVLYREVDLNYMLQRVVEILHATNNYKLVWIGKAKEDKTVESVACCGEGKDYVENLVVTWDDSETAQGPTGRAIREKRPVVNKNTAKNRDFYLWKDAALKKGYNSSIAVPIICSDGVFGALNVYSANKDDFDSKKILLLERLAKEIGFVIDKHKAEKEREYLKHHDRLTGLYNRSYFEDALERLDTERQLPLSIIIGDVNALKLTNDIFGHQAGDKLLREVAKTLKESCRQEDIIARWGGDEFIILLPQTNAGNSQKIINRIRQKCKERSSTPVPISIALGSATKKDMKEDIQGIIKRADDMMYNNKTNQSRNSKKHLLNYYIGN